MKKSKGSLVEIDAGLNKIVVGSAPISVIHLRRENPREMGDMEIETLRASMDLVGLQGFLRVEQRDDGEFDLVDGHHRLEEIKGRGSAVAPIIVLPKGLSKTDLDLLMLSLNVSGRVKSDPLAKLINDVLADGVDPDKVRKHATISPEFMDSIIAMTKDIPDVDLSDMGLDKNTGAKEPKKPKVPKVKLIEVRGPNGTTRILVPLDLVFDRESREALEVSGVEILSEETPKWCDTIDSFLSEVT